MVSPIIDRVPTILLVLQDFATIHSMSESCYIRTSYGLQPVSVGRLYVWESPTPSQRLKDLELLLWKPGGRASSHPPWRHGTIWRKPYGIPYSTHSWDLWYITAQKKNNFKVFDFTSKTTSHHKLTYIYIYIYMYTYYISYMLHYPKKNMF